jgi:hypothetical protein
MNRKNAARYLRKVHQEWLESITDKEVQKLVQMNSVITGGAIASLLLNEKVHDIDIYFTNFETTKTVTEYYIKKFIETNDVNHTPKLSFPDLEAKRVKIIVKSVGFITEEGDEGYQYFEAVDDEYGEAYIDDRVQCEDNEVINEQNVVKEIISNADEVDSEGLEDDEEPKAKFRPVFMTSNAITLSNGIQLVVRFYGTADQIHENYDFTHCTNYWESINHKLTLRPEAIEALLARELRYQGSKYPLCSVIRTRKFLRRGWHINAGQYLKMCFQISELDLKDIEVLEDQLTGVDTAYFRQIIERLQKKQAEDPNFTLDSAYLVSLIDKIF